ncbi:hypothetical protein [Paenibacillus sinopodophylli]|uniref:hypothetical protein n=1 Tax=Paenibacillus sinopodophylli TaxID=1837342 RepID=UPI00110D1663|nr:hypothetical protein [Paenibacillus sinopodophylli]
MARFLIMWIPFVLWFSVAAWGLELWEGYKITTTEYYGLRNIGFAFLAIIVLAAIVLYVIAAGPLTIVLYRFIPYFPVRMFIYAIAGGASGVWVFRNMYNDYFVRGYDLNMSSAILIFTAMGLAYAITDYWLQIQIRRKDGRWEFGNRDETIRNQGE